MERTAEQGQFLVPAVEILFVEVFFILRGIFILQSFFCFGHFMPACELLCDH